MPRSSQSNALWSFFTVADSVTKIAKCNFCDVTICYRTTISNLRKHLMRKHPAVPLEPVSSKAACPSINRLGEYVLSPLDDKLGLVACSGDVALKGEAMDNHYDEPTVTLIESQPVDGENVSFIQPPPNNSTLIENSKSSKLTSIMWKYFSVVDRKNKVAKCNLCGKINLYKTTVSNLKKHLIRIHPNVVSVEEAAMQDQEGGADPEMSHSAQVLKCSRGEVSVRQRTSSMWSYFSKLDHKSKIAECNLCGRRASYKSTVSNLKKHMERKHPVVELQFISDEGNYQYESGVGKDQCDISQLEHSYNVPPEDSQDPPTPSTPSPEQKIHEKLPDKISLLQIQYIDKQLIKIFTSGLMPFSTVEEESFRNFSRALNPLYKLPQIRTIMDNWIPMEYERCLNAVSAKLSTSKSVCLTAESWACGTNDFLTLMAHYINDNFREETVLFGCLRLKDDPVDVLALEIRSVINSFDLEEKIVAIVTDHSPKVCDAFEMLAWKRFECFAQTINITVIDALKTIAHLQKKVCDIVSSIIADGSIMKNLVDAWKNAELEREMKRIEETPDVWISFYRMFQWSYELKNFNAAALSKELLLTDEEWSTVKDLITALKPFEDVTEQIGGNGYMPGSLVIPLTRGLTSVCEKLQEEDLSAGVRQVVEALNRGLTGRLNNVELDNCLGLSTFLDPRFKMLAFDDKTACEKIKDVAIDLVSNLIESRKTTSGDSQESECDAMPSYSDGDAESRKDAAAVNYSVWDVIDRRVSTTLPAGTPKSLATMEVERYINDHYLPRGEDPLEWWRDRQRVYPNLTALVKKKFNMRGSSVPCQQVLSSSGRAFYEKRSRIESSLVEQLLFVHYNSYLLN